MPRRGGAAAPCPTTGYGPADKSDPGSCQTLVQYIKNAKEFCCKLNQVFVLSSTQDLTSRGDLTDLLISYICTELYIKELILFENRRSAVSIVRLVDQSGTNA